MSYVDSRGAENSTSVLASAGINWTVTVTDDGTARNLTDTTITVVLKDDREQARDYGTEYGSETSLTMTVTDAANGIFTLIIPSSYFENKEGGRLSYECYMTASSVKTAILWGYIDVQERG